MARTHWTIRNYNAALAALKATGITHKQAQSAYKGMKERLGRPVFGVDVKRHPRIAKQEAKKSAPRESSAKSKDVKVKRTAKKPAATKKQKTKREPIEEFFVEEWESTAEYETGV